MQMKEKRWHPQRMLDVPGPHFALSELLIVVAAIICAVKLGKAAMWLAAAGSLLFGVIAAIGAFRFGLGEMDALEEIHQLFSQTGGAIALSLITSQLLLLSVFTQHKTSLALYVTLIGSAFVAFLVPAAPMPLFLAWLVVAILAAALMPAAMPRTRILRALLVGIFLINIVAVRQSPLLGVGLSWHMFHVLVAVWLSCVSWVILVPRTVR